MGRPIVWHATAETTFKQDFPVDLQDAFILALEQIASAERIAAAKIEADKELATLDADVKLQAENMKRQTALDTAQLNAQAGMEQARMSSDTTREAAQLNAQTTMHSAAKRVDS